MKLISVEEYDKYCFDVFAHNEQIIIAMFWRCRVVVRYNINPRNEHPQKKQRADGVKGAKDNFFKHFRRPPKYCILHPLRVVIF